MKATFLGPRTFIFGTRFCNFCQIYFTPKRQWSDWSRCDAIWRIEGRNDMHWTANDRSSSMHKKSALNSLWMRLNPPRKSQPTEARTPNPETTTHPRRAGRTGVTYTSRADGRYKRTPPQEPHSRIRKHSKKRFSLIRVHAPTRVCIGFECVTG